MEASELIERYVHEVGQSLPRKTRDDIQMELRSLLMDDLEERAGDKEPTVEMAAKMLIEYGKPETMAARYQPERYLIGPQLFPFYRMVILIVFAAVAFGLLISFGIAFVASGMENILSTVWSYLSAILQGGISAFAITTIIFAVIERVSSHKFDTDDESEWDPYDLESVKENDRSRIKKPELVAGIVFYLFIIVLFNFYPHWIGMVNTLGEGSTFLLILAPEFAVYIPFLTLYWAVAILLKLILLRQGCWQRSSRWMEFGLGLFGLFITYQIASGGPITTISWLDMLIRFGLWIGIIIGSIEALVQLFRLLRGEPRKPSGNIKEVEASY
jgi:hypothetical protein